MSKLRYLEYIEDEFKLMRVAHNIVRSSYKLSILMRNEMKISV